MNIGSSYLSQVSASVLDSKAQTDLKVLGQKAGDREAEIAVVAQDFESVFITQMLQHMFAGVEVNEEFGGGHGEETFRTLLFDEYGKTISNAGGFGIAEHVQRELLSLQEVGHGQSAR
jgi:flagellar protein FlgJ